MFKKKKPPLGTVELPSTAGGSAGVHVPRVKIFPDVLFAEPEAPTDTNGRHLPRLDEAVDRHVGHAQLARDFGNG